MFRLISTLAVVGLIAGCETTTTEHVVASPETPVVVVPSGAVVVPPRGVVVPPGVVYVAPVQAVPAKGYVWRYNATYGWGWYHPRYGWYAGWK